MHLLQAARPEGDEPAVLVAAEVHEVFQQPVGKPLVASGTGSPGFGQHGVVGPVVANALLAEDVLVGGAGGVASAALLPGELPLGVWQLEEDRA